ncbi:MAG: hypothetical protein ABII82_09455 [Verrucomicrobiota bacterium]
MNKKLITILAIAGVTAGATAQAQTFVNSNITTNTTWGGVANPSPIILDGAIFVKDGATLTILPGTIVRGQPRTVAADENPGDPTGTPGALIVTQTGRIFANGTAEEPIIMTTAAIDNNNDGIADVTGGFKTVYEIGDTFLDEDPMGAPLAPLDKAGLSNVSLWGGLIVLGNAPTNNADKGGVGYGKVTVEGLTVPGFPAVDATYGGVLPNDSSGVLRYVSVRHAGDEIGSGNELNGVTLAGVGSGTTIENVEVYCNFDDGFEWFGGTANGKNLVVFFAGDDAFDIDEGYTGVNQFLFTIMPFFNENDTTAFGSASGDKAGEFDGDNYRPDALALYDNVNIRLDITQSEVDTTPWPLSSFVMWNMTVIGSTPAASPEFTVTSAASTNRGLQFRNGAAGTVFNSFIIYTGGETGIEIDGGTAGAPGFNATDNVANGLIALVSSTTASGTAFGTNETLASSNGNTLATKFGGTANVINGTNTLTQGDVTFDPTGNASGKLDASLKASPIDPRPTNAFSGVVGGVPPFGPGVDTTATYRGAFARTAPVLWTTGWTAMNLGGLLAD